MKVLLNSLSVLCIGFTVAKGESYTAASGTISDIETANQSIDGGSGTTVAFFESVQILGVPKFDTNLGVLSDVSFTISYDFTFDFGIYGDAIDLGEPFSIDGSATAVAGFFLSNGSGFGSLMADELTTMASCTGSVEGCADYGSSFLSLTNEVRSLSSGGNLGYLSSFVGVGDVSLMYAGIFFPLDSELIGINTEPLAEGSSVLSNISYSVEYIYSVPEPSSLLLLGLGLVGFVRRSRK